MFARVVIRVAAVTNPFAAHATHLYFVSEFVFEAHVARSWYVQLLPLAYRTEQFTFLEPAIYA